MKKDIIVALAAYITLFVISFYMSIVLGLGKAESHHDPFSLWMYGRRLIMIICAILIPLLTRKETLAHIGWKTSIRWVLIATGVGIVMGFNNKGGFDPTKPIAIVLALFHAFATELFFRRYLFKTFSVSFQNAWTPLLLSSFLYGCFYLTVWTTWAQPLGGKIAFVILFTLLGSIFAYGYKKSGSFLVPWMMHFFAVLKYRAF